MNERIKLLAQEAGMYVDLNGNSWPKSMSAEECEAAYKKFAELIVRECAKFLEENSGYDESNNAWHPEPEDLLKHFGVES